jgi:hypothetical protein
MPEDEERRTASVGLRLKPSTRDALERLAKADKRKLAPYIELVLEDHIATKKAASKRTSRPSK